MSLHEFLTLGAAAAAISVIGSLIGTILKDFLFARSLEGWKARQQSRAVFRRYKDPLLLSATEFARRINEALTLQECHWLAGSLVGTPRPDAPSLKDDQDPYYVWYKFASTIYRFAAFLGWLELYRQDVTFLDSGNLRQNKKLESRLQQIREDLADGQINDAEDWKNWHDALIFREEQRAIGDLMITSSGNTRSVMSYAQFLRLLSPSEASPKALDWRVRALISMLIDLGKEGSNDFRRYRLSRLTFHLSELIWQLDKSRFPEELAVRRDEWRSKHSGSVAKTAAPVVQELKENVGLPNETQVEQVVNRSG